MSCYSEICVDLIYSFFLLTLFPFLIILFSPIYLFRWTIGRIVPIFSNRLLKLVPLHSSIYLESSPELTLTFNILVSATVGSQSFNFERFVELVDEKVICAKNPDGGCGALYPELQQCFSIWMGYHWWTKCDEYLNVQNHVHKCQIQEGKSAFQFQTEWIQIPLESRKKSPWEVVVLETGDSKCVIIFKFHHAMADGYAIFKLVMKMADIAVPRFESKGFSDISWWKRCLLNISFPIRGTYELMKKGREIKSVTPPWMVTGALSDPRLFGISNRIPTGKFKEISKKLSVSTLTAYQIVLTRGFRKFLLDKVPEEEIPKFFTAVFPIPAENHPDGLVNHFYFTSINLPIGLRTLEEQISYCSNSIQGKNLFGVACACKANSVITKLIAGLPIRMRFATTIPDISLSMFPGPIENIYLNGALVERLHFMATAVNFISMVVCLLTYDGGVEFTVTAGQDSTVFLDQSSVQELIGAIEDQLDILRLYVPDDSIVV